MNKKILFFDIDGTLLTEDTYTVPQSAIRALKEARKKGHLIYINTGRTYSIVDTLVHDIGFDGYVCGCGTYIKSGETVLLSNSIEEEECKRIIDLLRKCKVDAILEGHDDVYFDDSEDINPYINEIRINFALKGYGYKKKWSAEGLIFDKFFCVKNEDSDIQTFYNQLEEKYEIINRDKGRSEVIPKGFSKATGIKYLLDYHNIPLEDAFAFGDGSNDIPMLSYVPNSVAMGQGEACALEVASYITKGIHEDGIEHALKHFGII